MLPSRSPAGRRIGRWASALRELAGWLAWAIRGATLAKAPVRWARGFLRGQAVTRVHQDGLEKSAVLAICHRRVVPCSGFVPIPPGVIAITADECCPSVWRPVPS